MGSIKALNDEGFVCMYTLCTKKVMPKNLKIQFCTHVFTWAQKSESQSVWNLSKPLLIKG